MENITFKKLIKKTNNGKIFFLEYYKGADLEKNCGCFRRGVKKYLKGGSLNYDAIKKEILVSFNMGKEQYRSIKFENIIKAHIGKKVYAGPMHPDNFAKRMEEIDQHINNINELTNFINK